MFGDGRFRDTFLDVVDAVWNHAQSLTHRDAATKEDALRASLWTGLLVSEFAGPLREYTKK